jgi:hypothetical protein
MGTGKSALMAKIAAKAAEKGFEVEIYHTPLIPSKIGSIIIKDLDIAVTSSDKFKELNEHTIDLNQYLNEEMINSYQEEIETDNKLLKRLIDLGIENIRKAKEEHDILEQYYVPNMNFAAANEKYEEILSRILRIAECKTISAAGVHH